MQLFETPGRNKPNSRLKFGVKIYKWHLSHSYPPRNTTGKPEVSQVMDLDFLKTLTNQLTLIINSTNFLSKKWTYSYVKYVPHRYRKKPFRQRIYYNEINIHLLNLSRTQHCIKLSAKKIKWALSLRGYIWKWFGICLQWVIIIKHT